MSLSVNQTQLYELLVSMIGAHLPLLIAGDPGCGKTDIVYQAAHAAKSDVIISHPVVADPTDAKGVPWPKTQKGGEVTEAHFLPFGELALAMRATRPTVWFLDDLGQATPAVQASYMQLFLARRINGHKLPDHITFVAATNKRHRSTGVQGILEPVKSRFATIVELKAALDPWLDWAMVNDIPAELIAFLRLHPDKLHNFDPTADMVNSPSPRTWVSVSKLMKLGLSPGLAQVAYAGAVGEGVAGEYVAFLRMVESMPEVEAVQRDPSSAPIPTEPSILYAFVTALAARVEDRWLKQLLVYSDRLIKDRKTEFAVLMVRDVVRRQPGVVANADFLRYLEHSPQLHRIYLGEE